MASKYVFAVVLIVLGSVPTGAVVIAASAGPQADTTAGLELAPATGTNGKYANVSGNTLELHLEKLNDDAITTAHDVFTITVTDEDISAIWIEGDVDGLTFYDGTDPAATISESNPLELTSGETANIGVAIDTHEGGDSDGTFTVIAEYEDENDGSSPEPRIEATNLNVSPTTLESGEPVTVNATYQNSGNKRGTETARLTVDGTVVDQRSIELEPGETKSVSFDRTMYWPGTYDVGLEGVGTESVTVEGPPIDVVNASVDDATITAGESTTIRTTVRNPTDTPVERTLELSIDGIVVDSRAVSIPADGERTVTFERRFAAAGTYEVAVSGVSAGSVIVEEPGPFSIQNRELSAATTAALAPPATAGLLALAVVANRRWAVLR